MKKVDGRTVPAGQRRQNRRLVLNFRQQDMTYAEIAARTGLTQTGVFNICRRFKENGADAEINEKRRGRRLDTQRALTDEQEADILRTILTKSPKDIGLPDALWSPAVVQSLLFERHKVRIGMGAVYGYLTRWGFDQPKFKTPCGRSFRRRSPAIDQWNKTRGEELQVSIKRRWNRVLWCRIRPYRPSSQSIQKLRSKTRQVIGSKQQPRWVLWANSGLGKRHWQVVSGQVTDITIKKFYRRLRLDVDKEIRLVFEPQFGALEGSIRKILGNSHGLPIELLPRE